MTDAIFFIVTFADNVIVQALLAFPLLVSMVISYKYLRVPDVTMDGSSLVSAAVCVILLRYYNVGWPVSLIGVAITGFLAGMLTGVLIEVLRINGLLAGILNAFLLYSVGLLMIGATLDFDAGSTIFSLLKDRDLLITQGLPEGLVIHPYMILFLTITAIMMKAGIDWLLRREYGVVLRGTSTNEFILQLRQVNTKGMRILAFGFSNALVGLGATFMSMYDGSVQVMRWPGTIIFALSVVILGWEANKRLFRFLKFELSDTGAIILGAVVYFAIVRICYTISIPTALPRLVIACYIIVVLADVKRFWRRFREQRD